MNSCVRRHISSSSQLVTKMARTRRPSCAEPARRSVTEILVRGNFGPAD